MAFSYGTDTYLLLNGGQMVPLQRPVVQILVNDYTRNEVTGIAVLRLVRNQFCLLLVTEMFLYEIIFK